MPIIWKEAMSTGSEIIDNEHKYLFCLVNSVELALKLDEGARLVEMFLDQLEEYTRKHFEHEEKIQLKMRYPLASEHREEHRQILTNLRELRSKLAASQEPGLDKQLDISDLTEGIALGGAMDVEDYDPTACGPDGTENTSETLDKIVALLRHWVLDHVLTSDMKMKRFFQSSRR